MRNLLGRTAVAVALVAAPATLLAQGATPRHEFGIDLGLGFHSYSSPGVGSTTSFEAMTPVDVRMGFVSASPLSVEGRLVFDFNSRGIGANASYLLAPDVNLLYKLGRGSTWRRGAYLTGGLGLALANASNGAGGTRSGIIASLNGGIGTRIPSGSAAWRLEGFLAYAFRNTSLGEPGTLTIGGRVGLSLWH